MKEYLNRFQIYIKKDAEPQVSNNEVWEYTRVSSKEQIDNNSLTNQETCNRSYADKNDLEIVDSFGGTYESASGDFTRKEFVKMLDRIEGANEKPYAILVYKINRFSRTGTGGVSLLNKLIRELGVHLIETSSGLSTETEEGELRISEKLIEARRENISRTEVIKPGMKTWLESGKRLGNCPKGYTHYGPRVTDFERLSKEQKLLVNEEGRKLQKAFHWKLEGYNDAEIVRRLRAKGLFIYKQRLAEMWRKPFYCGINTNSLLDHPVKGHWEPLISVDDFWRLQDLLDNKRRGYEHKKENPLFPLSKFIHCAECGNPMTQYTVKAKKVDYYRCNYCTGMNINANTTKRSIRAGAHDRFIELLNGYSLDEKLIPLYRKQLEYTFKKVNEDRYTDKKSIETRLAEVLKKEKNLRRRYALGDIDRSMYDEFIGEIDEDKKILEDELKQLSEDLSNLSDYVDKALKICQNISKYWYEASYSLRRKIQNIIFPSGIYLTKDKTHYLTKDVNSIFAPIPSLLVNLEQKQEGLPSKYAEKSLVVAGVGLEPTTFGL